MKSHSKKGALLSLFLETEPQIPHVDPSKMHKEAIKRPAVGDTQIDEAIKQTSLFFAQWTPVENRAVQVGDFVSLDVDVIENTPPIPLFSNTRFEVTQKAMAKWMFDLVIGKNTGDQAEGISVPDESASEEEKKELAEKKVRLTVRAIHTATIPELDEAFFKQLGVNNLDEMRTNITQLLNKQADAHTKEEERKQVNDFLLKECSFDLPVTLIEKETEFRFRQLWQDTSFQEYWKNLSQEEKTSLIRTVQEQSGKAVRLFYLCRQILADANIQITPQELEPSSANTPLDLLMQLQQPHAMEKSGDLQQAEAYAKFVLEKAQDFIWRHAT
jgi:FKBP-type peptidyl-prolyl cis-trans isomerase (trigger factor)